MNPHAVAPASALSDSSQTALSRVCVVGLGYVGLPTALLFARKGFRVQGVDIDPAVCAMVSAEGGIAERYPELAEWTHSLGPSAADDPASGLTVGDTPAPADVFILTVPTPVHAETRRCDLRAVRAAAQSIVPALRAGNLVLLESTVPPGTTRTVVRPILEQSGLVAGVDFHLCFCPERILPGNTTHELVHNHRVLGGLTPACARRAQTLWTGVVAGELFVTDDVSAEFCKLAENTYRDVNIALANELSLIADEYHVDLKALLPIINQHPRVNLHTPGIGVGGHCIAVDPWFFVEASPWKTRLIRASREVNDQMPQVSADKIIADIADIDQPVILLAGLSYKPDVADLRESPALRIAEILDERGYAVRRYDPLLPQYRGQTLEQAAAGCDYLAILTPHTALCADLSLNREAILQAMRTPRVRRF